MSMRFMGKLRDPVSGLSHLLAALVAIAGLVALLAAGGSTVGKSASLAIYGGTLIALFSASASYHLIKSSPQVTATLRKLDHSAIYLLIAGTYTPFCFNVFSGFWKWGLLILVWGLAILGVSLKFVAPRTPRWLNTAMYLVLGWLVVFGAPQLLAVLPTAAIAWLSAGGVLYTLGAVVYVTKTLDFFPGRFGFHEVWHIFVILAALAHFVAVLVYVAPTA